MVSSLLCNTYVQPRISKCHLSFLKDFTCVLQMEEKILSADDLLSQNLWSYSKTVITSRSKFNLTLCFSALNLNHLITLKTCIFSEHLRQKLGKKICRLFKSKWHSNPRPMINILYCLLLQISAIKLGITRQFQRIWNN